VPSPDRITEHAWCYPELRIHYAGRETHPDASRAFGRLPYTGTYSTTVTRPALYADYLTEQLELLAADYDIEFEVGRSTQQIPFPMCWTPPRRWPRARPNWPSISRRQNWR
jgi:AMP nucleosidase